jgi:hypothetical protein
MPKYIATPHSADGLGRLRPGYHWAYAEPGLSTSDLMQAPYTPARGLSRWPDRMSAGGPKPVREGYIVGSKADAVCTLIGITPIANERRSFGEVNYVKSRTPKAVGPKPAARQSAEANRLDRQADEAERLRTFAKQYAIVGQADWLIGE